MRQPTSYKWLS